MRRRLQSVLMNLNKVNEVALYSIVQKNSIVFFYSIEKQETNLLHTGSDFSGLFDLSAESLNNTRVRFRLTGHDAWFKVSVIFRQNKYFSFAKPLHQTRRNLISREVLILVVYNISWQCWFKSEEIIPSFTLFSAQHFNFFSTGSNADVFCLLVIPM